MMAKLRILVVDDDRNMTTTLLKILRLKGYRATVAHGGKEALDLAKKDHFDCVLSDIKMPGMSGVELFHALQEYHQDIPIILMTAYAPSDLLNASVAEGAVAVLNKPLDFDLLFLYLAAVK